MQAIYSTSIWPLCNCWVKAWISPWNIYSSFASALCLKCSLTNRSHWLLFTAYLKKSPNVPSKWGHDSWCEEWNELNSNELILHQNSQTESKSYTRRRLYINSLLSWSTCLVFISLICSFYSFIICHVVCYDRLFYSSSLFYFYSVMFLSVLSDDMLIEITDERLSKRLSQSSDDVLIHTFYSYVRSLGPWHMKMSSHSCLQHRET
jgi:hypothetical protein